ncbi:MAG: hypothetical protein B6230_01660 [Desulfobacteraceae bacterium 4572_89]|nr:MAG: hypothetical protein B6230_01660 [Desulfobacteraceae bacterium 4572_89]
MGMVLELSTTANINMFWVFYNRVIRFVRVGVLLHLTAMGGISLCFWFGSLVLSALGQEKDFFFMFHGFIACYGFVLVLFAELDAISRYQNYKKAKDLFHENGFKKRIVNLFVCSRCQRDAIKVAAKDLGLLEKLCKHYDLLGYGRYHILPDFIFSKPLIFFSRKYWIKTLFEKKYESKYFLW